jgi:hypothetical protein
MSGVGVGVCVGGAVVKGTVVVGTAVFGRAKLCAKVPSSCKGVIRSIVIILSKIDCPVADDCAISTKEIQEIRINIVTA